MSHNVTSRTHLTLRAPLPRGNLGYIYYLRFIDKLRWETSQLQTQAPIANAILSQLIFTQSAYADLAQRIFRER
jgi:hypothetical protein